MTARSNAERQAAYRARKRLGELEGLFDALGGSPGSTAAGRERERRRALRDALPFLGCDGEGAGTDPLGRQNYMLFRIGERELLTGEPLRTEALLDFICDTEPGALLVGFAFGYDTSMILRDLPHERRMRLFGRGADGKPLPLRPRGEGYSPFVYWGAYGIDYLPRNHLKICRTRRIMREAPDGTLYPARQTIPGSTRAIYDVFGFFQSSFTAAIGDWQIGTQAERDAIYESKQRRSEFVEMTAREREYCALECRLLGELMTKFRGACLGAGMRPKTWNGAGKLAQAQHEAHQTILAATVEATTPPGVLVYASNAYYGGHFETMAVGPVPGPVYEYDLRSAYPAAMLRLPCLEHGTWTRLRKSDFATLSPTALFVARMSFRHRATTPDPAVMNICGLPVRQRDGRLFWPMSAQGTYWSVESRAAEQLGCELAYHDGWLYHQRCNCHPLGWVQELYDYRKSLGLDARGKAIKLAINSLYGKLAQRIGNPKFANPIWASLITAITRASLIEAAAHDPAAVIMFATDAVFSRRPLPVSIGGGLGQWEAKEHASLFVVQPGVYWGPEPPEDEKRLAKTRGMSQSVFVQSVPRFERVWRAWAARTQAGRSTPRAPMRAGSHGNPGGPYVTVPMTLFMGLKLAGSRGKPELAGRWMKQYRRIRFDWTGKRSGCRWEGETVYTFPPRGSPDLVSMPHKGDPALIEEMDASREELDEQPDRVNLLPPWKDE